ncbi:ATP-dependent DNA helicase ii, 70 kDa subunit family protein [Terfezia boudieri ATCC MYA-4762]|uniref:ATP-dependent DNA helicase II subunit 1 n=1 Tax=Terfezia boudieri ATCC MYA-4762 TaxID=1051890 RepID=A0A3N4LJV3_9PEZI|nr:ATP-dependent DNA helicase ii, 70 kDa subunit family protein [Terfezia boudieri ATCC MYA-4762]
MSSDSKWRPQDDEADDEEEGEVDGTQYQSMKDAILFAIHVSPSMLSTHSSNDDEEDEGWNPKKKTPKCKPMSAVRTALQCAYEVLQQRIISNPKDMMGILLFGTQETKFPDGGSYNNCYLLMDLDVPDAPSIKSLKNLIQDEDEFNKVITPSEAPISMANVLFGANQIFTTKASNFQSRRLFLITDNDNPHSDDRALKNSAITRARDLYDLGVSIDPFYISNPGKPEFDPTKFYEDIIYRAPGGEDTDEDDTSAVHLKPTADGTLRLQEMISSIRTKATPKRALFTTKLELGPGLEIGVKGYILYKRQEKARSHYVYTGGEQPQIVKGDTTQLSSDTARVVEKTEIKKAYKFGGETVLFSPEELKEIRNFGQPVIRIIGFKPASALRFMDNVRPANFIYPTEAEFVGSTRVFAALHKKLLESDKIGIAWFIARRNAAPVLVALYPSEEKVESKVQIHPPGIFLIQLPFANDIRQNPETPLVRAPDTLVDCMRAIVKVLHMPRGYRPEKFSNPALQWHYRILQAIALDEEVPEKAEDNTLPKYKLIRKYAGEKVIKWGEELEEVMSADPGDGKIREKKRAAPEEDWEKAPAKKRAAKGGEEGLKDEEMRRAYEKGQVGKFTVVQLKGWLLGKRLEGKGKKADLVEKVEEWFDNH